MKQLFPRGKRIRPTDKDLVFYTALASLLPVFLLVVLLFHIGQIAGTNWQEVSLSQIVQDVNIPYLLFSMGVAGLVCLTAVLLFWRYRRDEVKQLIHRQKLARMVLENKWYESEQRKEDAFFKDLSSSRSKETITYFPKIYYRMKQGLLHIRVEITLGKYQEQLLNLERKPDERQKTTTTPAAPPPTRPVQNDTAPVIPERKRAAPAVKESNFTIRRTTARKEWTKTVTAASKQKKGEKP